LVDLGFQGKLVATSVIGGLAAVAGGGKFANGAVTAAFGYLFNSQAHCEPGDCTRTGLAIPDDAGGPSPNPGPWIWGGAGAGIGAWLGTQINAISDGLASISAAVRDMITPSDDYDTLEARDRPIIRCPWCNGPNSPGGVNPDYPNVCHNCLDEHKLWPYGGEVPEDLQTDKDKERIRNKNE
jgi:hypothetical protein